MNVKLNASVQGQVTGATVTVMDWGPALADELLRALNALWSRTGWHGNYKQTLEFLPRTGDDLKFILTWEQVD